VREGKWKGKDGEGNVRGGWEREGKDMERGGIEKGRGEGEGRKMRGDKEGNR